MKEDNPKTHEVTAIYRQLLQAWNEQRASDYAELFDEEGHIVGFDGTMISGRSAIADHLSGIFAHHRTATYVSKLLGVETLAPDVSMLRAVVGMVPPGQSDLNTGANAVQTLVARRRDGRWRVVMFQNTPAAFHGRPEAQAELSSQLRDVLRHNSLIEA